MIKSGSNEALSIVVFGYANTVNATDATLSALSVSGASLNPPFAVATTTYSTTVVNSVSQVTITETKSEPTATVEYLDGSDATRTDADTMTAGLQVNLSVGTNTVKVKVTAPDTTTTQTYTVNIVRLTPPVTGTQIWSATLTAGAQTAGTLVQAVGYERINVIPFGSLSDDDFDLAGTSYTVTRLRINFPSITNRLSLTLDTGLPAAFHPHLTLHLGSDSFPLATATVGALSDTFTWIGHGLSWADTDMISVSLTDSSTPVVPPAVSSVALTSDPGSDNTYGIGDDVAATVTFDAAVDITGTRSWSWTSTAPRKRPPARPARTRPRWRAATRWRWATRPRTASGSRRTSSPAARSTPPAARPTPPTSTTASCRSTPGTRSTASAQRSSPPATTLRRRRPTTRR